MSNRRHHADQAVPERADDAEVIPSPAGDAPPVDPAGPDQMDPVDPDHAGAPEAEQTTDYTRAGGHVLTDFGWVLEEQVR